MDTKLVKTGLGKKEAKNSMSFRQNRAVGLTLTIAPLLLGAGAYAYLFVGLPNPAPWQWLYLAIILVPLANLLGQGIFCLAQNAIFLRNAAEAKICRVSVSRSELLGASRRPLLPNGPEKAGEMRLDYTFFFNSSKEDVLEGRDSCVLLVALNPKATRAELLSCE